ncbi:DUF3231 family protein [Halobacillus shinanisalinarum]|uniref:DUF3231 family protein n=1 Tax=Halobacillus shinanisalinarum TaxID=2932258 RepID=A0ABY4GVV7_9BACI|nr:DUF3231 family protein [Halobacillus shinanisalinarum]UOQ92169.1 DUF3231 family protein [Halobacillus shinanisalinarum]
MKTNQTQLTAPEIANLWISYQNDSMSFHMISYLAKHTEDREIRSVLEYAIRLSKEHVTKVTQMLKKEKYPIPAGFTENDVNIDAPRLYSDNLCLYYMIDMAKFALPAYGLALSITTRDDVMAFYSRCLNETQELFTKATKLAIKKGIYIFAPTIPTPDEIDFVKRQDFLAGWFDRRPLLGIEISDLIYNTKRTALGEALVTGFAQTAKATEVRKYFERGKRMTKKHFETFSSILLEGDLPQGSNILTSEVTTSTIAPFSDKMMMYHATTFTASGVAQYGFAVSIQS